MGIVRLAPACLTLQLKRRENVVGDKNPAPWESRHTVLRARLSQFCALPSVAPVAAL